MRHWKSDPLSSWLLRRTLLPTLIIGGLIVAVVAGYRTEQAKSRCRQLAVERGYLEGRISPSRHGPDECVCRGKRNPDGSIDQTVSERIPLR